MNSASSLVSAARALEKKMEITSNNLTNVDTVGYKADYPTFREVLSTANRVVPESGEELFKGHEYLDLYVGMDKSSVIVDGVGKDFTQGAMRRTDNALDIAIDKDGFFSVLTPQGERYTRTGHFTLNAKGQIVSHDGYTLLGKNGPITIKGNDIKIDENGGVYEDGKFLDKLKLVLFRHPESLQKLGKSFYAPIGGDNIPISSDEIRVRQGMIENSNVNTIKEMVSMIGGNRAYETVRKAIRTMDRLDEKAISISRIG